MEALKIADLKALFPLSLEDDAITPHLNRAIWDYNDIEFEDELQMLEVVGSKALYYLAPLLFVDMQNRAEEFSESLETFKDVESFKKNWLERAESALFKQKVEDEDEIQWVAL